MEWTGPRAGKGRPRASGLIVVGLISATGIWVGRAWWGRANDTAARHAALESPYKNVHPGVKYVGDTACARCHADIAESFRRHPMGRSLTTAAEAAEREVGGESAAK